MLMKHILAAVLILSIPATAIAQEYQCPYLVMEKGKQWVYTGTAAGDTLIASVVDTAAINGQFYYRYAPYGPNPSWPRYWLRPEPWRIFALDMDDSTEYLLFDFQADVNDSWDIPPDLCQYNVPVNQCDWGSRITLMNKTDTVYNPNRIFVNTMLFSHQDHPCYDAGIGNTNFARDFGMVHFSQTTEGCVIDWHLIVDPPDTVSHRGIYAIVGNPCLNDPCLPGVVSAVQVNDTCFIITKDDHFCWNGEFEWNGYAPVMGDSVVVTGAVTLRTDIFGRQYSTIDVADFFPSPETSVQVVPASHPVDRTVLRHNFPNPFNSGTIIEYTLAESGHVRLVVTDILGRAATTLVNEYQNAGTHSVACDGTRLLSGVYFYQLFTKHTVRTKSFTVTR